MAGKAKHTEKSTDTKKTEELKELTWSQKNPELATGIGFLVFNAVTLMFLIAGENVPWWVWSIYLLDIPAGIAWYLGWKNTGLDNYDKAFMGLAGVAMAIITFVILQGATLTGWIAWPINVCLGAMMPMMMFYSILNPDKKMGKGAGVASFMYIIAFISYLGGNNIEVPEFSDSAYHQEAYNDMKALGEKGIYVVGDDDAYRDQDLKEYLSEYSLYRSFYAEAFDKFLQRNIKDCGSLNIINGGKHMKTDDKFVLIGFYNVIEAMMNIKDPNWDATRKLFLDVLEGKKGKMRSYVSRQVLKEDDLQFIRYFLQYVEEDTSEDEQDNAQEENNLSSDESSTTKNENTGSDKVPELTAAQKAKIAADKKEAARQAKIAAELARLDKIRKDSIKKANAVPTRDQEADGF